MKKVMLRCLLFCVVAGCSSGTKHPIPRDRLLTTVVPNQIYGEINWSLYLSRLSAQKEYCEIFFTEDFTSSDGALISGVDFGSTQSSFLIPLGVDSCNRLTPPFIRVVDLSSEEFGRVRSMLLDALETGNLAGMSDRTKAAIASARLISLSRGNYPKLSVSFFSEGFFYSLQLDIDSKKVTVLQENVWQ